MLNIHFFVSGGGMAFHKIFTEITLPKVWHWTGRFVTNVTEFWGLSMIVFKRQTYLTCYFKRFEWLSYFIISEIFKTIVICNIWPHKMELLKRVLIEWDLCVLKNIFGVKKEQKTDIPFIILQLTIVNVISRMHVPKWYPLQKYSIWQFSLFALR